MRPIIMNCHTGQTHRDNNEREYTASFWGDGAGNCDCTRGGHECGHYFRVIVDVEGDLEGHTKEDILADMNLDYPDDVVALAMELYRNQHEGA